MVTSSGRRVFLSSARQPRRGPPAHRPIGRDRLADRRVVSGCSAAGRRIPGVGAASYGPGMTGRSEVGDTVVRRVAWVVRSAAVSVTAFLAALACAGTELARAESGRTDLLTRYDAWVLLAVAAALAVSVALWWRDRHPAAVAVGAGLTGVLLPVGAVAGLLALPAVLRRGTRRQAAAGVVAVVAASAAWAWRDLRGPTPDSSLGRTLLAPSAATQAPTDVAPAGVVVLLALPLGLAVAVGLYLRARGDAEDSRRTAQRERATRGALDERLARQAERERIARE